MFEFEWESEKERLIAKKHNISMDEVKRIFDDPFRIMQYDRAHSGLEERWQTLGKANKVLFAVFTERGAKTRIITARKATSEERSVYNGESEKGNWFIP